MLLGPTSDDEWRYMEDVPYANVVGALMYAMVCTRPDLSRAITMVCRYMHDSGKKTLANCEVVLRYLRGTF